MSARESNPIDPVQLQLDEQSIVFYCRPGYEKDAADEIAALCALKNWFGYPNFKVNDGFLIFHFFEKQHAQHFANQVSVDCLIFSRQAFLRLVDVSNLPKTDRVGTVLDAIALFVGEAQLMSKEHLFGSVTVDFPDTESGKNVAKFAKKFTVPLRQAMRKSGYMSAKENLALTMLHVFMTDFAGCFIGRSLKQQRCKYHNGIHRLKFPAEAPSRSTLKLEEALEDLVPPAQRSDFLREGARAVDLGACPGGWTFQLVKHLVHVEAVDNGEMADSLMRTGLVTYAAADGFKYKPEFGVVDLVVCDMIERPDRVAELMLKWLTKPFARAAIFNLKLPMKMRYETVQGILENLQSQLNQNAASRFKVRCKHLYHDRDEVTVTIVPA